jgi:hypothetical protein
MDSNTWLGPLIAAILTLTAFLAIVGVVWQTRARAAKRWKALLDVYAQREIMREGRQKARKRLRTFSTPGDLLAFPRASQAYPLQLPNEGSES